MAYKRRRGHSHTKPVTFALNVTSMTDMFTILLVFLLQTYSGSDIQVTPEKDISLPQSSVDTNPILALKVSLSKNQLLVEGKKILSMTEGQYNPADVDRNDKNFLPGLFNELDSIAKNAKAEEIKDGKIILQADSALSYEVIKKVMYTASMAGFPKMKMAVVVGE